MDVEYRPDGPAPKNFKDSRFHFLMLLLAVSLTFVAHYYLDSLIERHHEKQFISNFINDVKKDTIYIKKVINYNNYFISGIDSLLALRTQDISNQKNRKLFYQYCYDYAFNQLFFRGSDPTLKQLTNSGGYRLIRNLAAADSMLWYEQSLAGIMATQEGLYQTDQKGADLLYDLIDITCYDDTIYMRNQKFLDKELPQILNDTQKLKKLYNYLKDSRDGMKSTIERYYEPLLEYAERLMPFLQKEFE
jgi:hypothetical protein